MIESFKEDWLSNYYWEAVKSKKIPSDIESALNRKLSIIHAAVEEKDLRCPPGNRFEHLQGNLKGWCSIRVSKQYRLIFKWADGKATQLYLDAHKYK
ncbi:toxin [Bermanella marisrubri]|uniref:Killer protein, putative n=1 Tax=Bermanella marisrubri TaxID=207949 RepID=Q1N2S2_9GAMM|nr:type II toxin-antitoxin system RelE/ParE family toxin [Bermanella marisrubri]EAT12597.1 killer protein, putative [Oceanobacter sp. RED65] [Bermanella marisrubri]QIZ84850.1 toxin [Bermanella marisrubri]